MSLTNKELSRFYIYATINGYRLYSRFVAKGDDYRDFKIHRIIEYSGLNIKPGKSLIRCIVGLYYIEIPISVFIEIVLLIKCLLLKLKNRKKNISKQLVMFGRGANVDFSVIKKTHIEYEDIEFLTSPMSNSKLYLEYSNQSILGFVSYGELLSAFLQATKMTCYLPVKYGHRDCFFRSSSAFEFFLVGYAFNHIGLDKTVIFTPLNDRFAYLFGHLPNKKIFIQHGAVPNWFSVAGKIGMADIGYYFNEEQRVICNKVMFYNIPECRYMELMSFTSNDKIIKDGKLNVLLICYQLYFEKEKQIIEDLTSNENIHLYVKPHPTDNDRSKYTSIQKSKSIAILEKEDFPLVDVVISYESTLALEYRMVNVKTIVYEDIDFENQYKTIKYFTSIEN